MSNTAVGQVYNRVIEAVIEASKIDFEENGVNHETLENLRKVWQDRLSQTDRALFPWDPQPTASANTATQPGTPSNQESNITDNHASAPAPAPTAGPSSNAANGNQANGSSDVRVKQEQNFDNSFLNLPQQQNYTSGLGSQYPSQRAAQLLQEQFGSQASGSIDALQAAGMRQQQPNQGRGGSDANASVKVENNPSAQVKQETSESDLGRSQTDGSSESATEQWDAVIARRNAHGENEPMGRIAVDRVIRRHVEAMGRRLEGGGLMIPLDERYPIQQQKRRKRMPTSSTTLERDQVMSTGGGVVISSLTNDMAKLTAGFDGPGDSDSDDDAINSDLDDPDETADNSIEGQYEGDVILCLYDKVQRVKNKWKCVLKDGVVTVDGRDYVFHKASGEFEW